MPVGTQTFPSPSTSLQTGHALLFSGLALLFLVACGWVAIRKRQNAAEAHRAHPPPSQAQVRSKPRQHDVHLATSVRTSTWRDIQPLSVQSPSRLGERQDHRRHHQPTIKETLPLARSHTSIDSEDEMQIFFSAADKNFDCHHDLGLQITVFIAMPMPLPSVPASHGQGAGNDMAIGIADAVFLSRH
ncbi:hypothetical protein C8R46DRAFT_424161 [Mycena filopes]|nr:hypothetical protein C8R46DRAFT_424161 [Mycena filopes]